MGNGICFSGLGRTEIVAPSGERQVGDGDGDGIEEGTKATTPPGNAVVAKSGKVDHNGKQLMKSEEWCIYYTSKW